MIEEATNAVFFLEMRTNLGDTTQIAAKHFPTVHSIENNEELFKKAKKRFAKRKNITLHLGDAINLLPTILKKTKDKMAFFLDAHSTSILTELNQIKKSNLTDSIIIIDDIGMFYDSLLPLEDSFREGYPTLNTIVEVILDINPIYKIAIIYDTLIAFTSKEQITVSPLVRATTMSRLYDGSNYLIEDIICAELCIAQAKDVEKDALLELAERWVEKFSEAAGLSRHYALWGGLIFLNNENYTKAKELLLEAKKRGIRDWRIDWYIAMADAQCFFDIR